MHFITQTHDLCEEEICNKKAHLRRLRDDIASKMTDTHALNRECDKATVSFAEAQHQQLCVAARLQSSSLLVSESRTEKENMMKEVQMKEAELEMATKAAGLSEKELSERIDRSKATISCFFTLKKEVNAKEWELSKARRTLEQAVIRQEEILAELQSKSLVISVQQEADAQEAR